MRAQYLGLVLHVDERSVFVPDSNGHAFRLTRAVIDGAYEAQEVDLSSFHGRLLELEAQREGNWLVAVQHLAPVEATHLQATAHHALMPAGRIYEWPEIRRGNCVMQAGSTLTIDEYGHAYFRAVVWTTHTHSGDTWQHSLIFLNQAKQYIFVAATKGPNHMNDGDPPPHYNFVWDFAFSPDIFPAITEVIAYSRC